MALSVHGLKRKKIFLNLFWFKINFKKQKSKFSNSFFDFKSKIEFQKVLSFPNFGYEIEKWKVKNFQNLFCFEIKKRIILSVHWLESVYRKYNLFFDLKTKRILKILHFSFFMSKQNLKNERIFWNSFFDLKSKNEIENFDFCFWK